ncbi:hypothetical protein WR25_00939 [Diploscapter pachys]|uniref:Uncharacterized protein n=1 Tax=Diploscapter pachys TaxID=2018661 RepID=A0A2A2M4L1_9BILA|nr:hypothetical protein WR25_00939 [Diploscapter pachys]
MVRILILPPDRNDGHVVAARDAHDGSHGDGGASRCRTRRTRTRQGHALDRGGAIALAGRHRAALVARHVGAGGEAGAAALRLGGDAQHHRLFALGIARHLHRAIGDRFFEFAGIVGQRTQRQRQLADRARDGDLFGHLGRRLQRDGGIGADLGLAVLAHDIVAADRRHRRQPSASGPGRSGRPERRSPPPRPDSTRRR